MVKNWACQGHDLYIYAFFMPPTSKKLKGKNWFGPVRLSVHQPTPPPSKIVFLDFDSL